ncbi:metal-dependent hydrolase [Syntrophotalea acetylenica]|uniref:Membrane-bound metal-dependent hydrolase n=1 Tax=Syntrophotalea acetylenica TaxID=29542 RepID=A0A1L3GDQ4_SYNAC|nr:metal-dependent hydrolase [Syntrophotalea acetylenica]APG23945.1 hypothetical protein A7E75_02080 [Syntrophotalea acetylenica]APG44526.1 hypothetical protein A6070_10700 [Syntrophotalea acetylenica]
MRWQNHKICTVCIVFAAVGRILPAIVAGFGSVLPDLLEAGLVRHRTLTHWTPFYIITGVIMVPMARAFFLPAGLVTAFLILGCLCHIVQDGLSRGGVPLFTPNGRRFGAGFYITRTITETLVVSGIMAISLLVAADKGYFGEKRILGELRWLLSWH